MLLISLEKVTFSRISLEKAVKTPLCALIFLKKHPKICEIREICELSELLTKSAKSAKSASAKNSPQELRERKAQDGNNLRRNWFIGGCPISWRRPTLPPSHAVPSARTGLTALFGMGRGVPRGYNRHCLLNFLAYSTHINTL